MSQSAPPSSARHINAPLFIGGIFAVIALISTLVLSMVLGVGWGDILDYIGMETSIVTTGNCGEEQTIFPYWEGEYPTPVVAVAQPQNLMVREEICAKEAQKPCSIKEGLYHPWAKEKLNFATIKGILQYKSIVSFASKKKQYPKGTIVSVEGSLGEGYCLLRVDKDHWTAQCPDMPNALGQMEFTLLQHKDIPNRQYIQLICEQGYRGWLEVDNALFQQAGIGRGVITGYGKIAAKSHGNPQ